MPSHTPRGCTPADGSYDTHSLRATATEPSGKRTCRCAGAHRRRSAYAVLARSLRSTAASASVLDEGGVGA